MGLEEKLNRLCVAADLAGRRQLRRSVHDLSLLVAGALKTGKWADLPVRTQLKIDETADAAVAAADLADAADYVNRKVLSANHGKILDLKTSSDFAVIRDRIAALFEAKQVPQRGFVYVAWSARPEEFVYVGRAKDSGRLSLAAHGKLAHATATASTVSLLFPTPSRNDTIKSLEACMIRLVEHSTGVLPKLNDRRERLPMGDSLRELERLGTFLRGVAKRVTPLAD